MMTFLLVYLCIGVLTGFTVYGLECLSLSRLPEPRADRPSIGFALLMAVLWPVYWALFLVFGCLYFYRHG